MPSPAEILAALEESVQDMDKIEPVGLFMLYGKQGTGKTVCAIRIAQRITPPDKTILYIDYKQGWTSLLNHDPALRQRVKRIQYEGYSQLDTLADVIEAGAGSFNNVGAVVLDEHTSMAQDDLELLTRVRAKGDKEKDPDTPTWPDMNTGIIRSRQMLNKLANMGIHVILVCHERDNKDNKGVVQFAPAYLPKQIPKMSEPLHFVGRLDAVIQEGGTQGGTYVRTIQCHPSKTVVAKSRVGSLGVFETHESVIHKIAEWLASGGVPENEAAQVILTDEIDAHNPDIDPAITVE